ncbi:BTB/POZ domain and ankyrin repeat-containing protein NPR2 isoform X1 [Iris pallida]|uniref:BTB/POZ domain and ankyrin repeat-containing protein NPR2 isoform X1 n=1 Tax=Iris pallida TaxID=29817 RepID=A0AAX6ICM0_IRIPA|nr:BTB/POZ domain and ankyrin repeat-containing protein NPR2 isoform X1 [Iris pallida]
MAAAATNPAEPSTSSSCLSNGTSTPAENLSPTNLEIVSLSKLSSHLERLLLDAADPGFTDADVSVHGGAHVGVHRCILAARSRVFRDLFSASAAGAPSGSRPRYAAAELLPPGARLGKEAFMVFLGYVYTGKLRPAPPEAATCVDPVCAHDACRPAIAFAVEMMYAAHAFDVPELVSLFQRRLLNFVDKTLVEDVIPIVVVAFHAKLHQLLDHCVQRIARSDLDNVSLEKELPCEVVVEIKSTRRKFPGASCDAPAVDPIREKGIRRIHGALDSDDVELVKLLLTESDVTLDHAAALHYAAAYCDSKIVAEVLELGLADINLKNERGYTPLHVAAMRREPAVIVSLLDKGASVSETTADGQDAVSICRRLTRAKDYYAKIIQGQESSKDRICIDILEREMNRSPMACEDSVTSVVLADNLQAKLLYLENRVGFARLLFPAEAKVAMEIAHAEPYSEFANRNAARSSANLREVDLNETPSVQNKRLRTRVDALTRTVELGRRYFPHCSQVLDRLMSDDAPDLFHLQKGTPDEQKIKRMRFCELKEDVRKAFSKDKAAPGHPSFCSSSSSSSSQKGDAKQHRAATRK